MLLPRVALVVRLFNCMKLLTFYTVLFAVLLQTASAQNLFAGWQHHGSLHILTTPEGANLPATAVETDFPLLVRLDKDWFDFTQAKANGEDVRFAVEGRPLAFQIEE